MRTVSSILLILTFFISHLDAKIVRRAAFDFGSGKIKIQVADVDTKTGSILKNVYTDDAVVLLSEDLAQQVDGYFSLMIQKKAIETARQFKQKAVELGATDFCGLATEAYRKARNGQDLIAQYREQLQISVRLISQEEEGKLGFLALVNEKGLDPLKTVCWDIGGGSFQITYMDEEQAIHVFKGPFGRSTTKIGIISHVKHQNPCNVKTVNPMSMADWNSALRYLNASLPPVPASLVLKLKDTNVQLIGISAHPRKLRDLNIYSLDDILTLLESYIDKSDEDLNGQESLIPDLALVYSVMHMLEVDHVNYVRTNSGSSSALLVLEEYWKE